jgi:hypothetical protein
MKTSDVPTNHPPVASFNGIWSDMGTEKAIMKDSKGSGGIVGITNQKSALHACRNIHETRRVGLYIKGVSHGFIQMVYYCLDLFLISLQSCLLHFFM